MRESFLASDGFVEERMMVDLSLTKFLICLQAGRVCRFSGTIFFNIFHSARERRSFLFLVRLAVLYTELKLIRSPVVPVVLLSQGMV
jgi:hypothetical protein